MKKFLFSLVAFVSISAASYAVLPPLWQNVAELKAILEDKRLGDVIQSGEIIVDIRKSDGGWTLITNHNEVNVKVIYQAISKPGPAAFNLEFEAPKQL